MMVLQRNGTILCKPGETIEKLSIDNFSWLIKNSKIKEEKIQKV